MDSDDSRRSKVPRGRLSRLARVAKLAGGVAGGMLAEGGRQLRAGNRPSARDLLLTPRNAQRVADQLAHLRGAAMKMGQMLSMDAGDLLPRELTDILSRLRSDAQSMPIEQLQQTMTDAYGEDWLELFYGFDFEPIAAASIGQVHRAFSPDGREIALKIQYPGVRDSIDSDVDNMASLLRLSGLVPDNVEIAPLLAEMKQQLRDEADYLLEAEHLAAFGEQLHGDERFVVPEVLNDLCRDTVLVMTYTPGTSIEALSDASQAERDRVMTALIDLMLTEFFELRMVQTDPNFANYHYRADTGQIVLLDFGATRRYTAKFVNSYKRLAKAAIAGSEERIFKALVAMGYAVESGGEGYRALLMEVFGTVHEPMLEDAPYDFGASDLSSRLQRLGEQVNEYKEFWQPPPPGAIYFHRKLGGMFLLASRLEARVNVHHLVQRWLN